MAQGLIVILAIFALEIRTSYQIDETTLPSLVAEIQENSRFKTLKANATLLKLLVDKNNGVTLPEIFDMLHSRDEQPNHVDLPPFPQDEEVAEADVPLPPDSQAEYLQSAGQYVEKDAQSAKEQNDGGTSEPFGLATGIMVGVTCAVVCGAYISLIVWRRRELKKSGMKHELLRNEDNIAETRIEL